MAVTLIHIDLKTQKLMLKLEVEVGGKALADEARAKGDKLIADVNGKWKKAADVTGYALYLEVTALNTLAGKGVVAIVRGA